LAFQRLDLDQRFPFELDARELGCVCSETNMRPRPKPVDASRSESRRHDLTNPSLKLVLLEGKIDAGQDLIFPAGVRLALNLPADWAKETVNELIRDRRSIGASEEGEP
jgi:hypothetical protein